MLWDPYGQDLPEPEDLDLSLLAFFFVCCFRFFWFSLARALFIDRLLGFDIEVPPPSSARRVGKAEVPVPEDVAPGTLLAVGRVGGSARVFSAATCLLAARSVLPFT